jgi:CheY-like chemotaxis protein
VEAGKITVHPSEFGINLVFGALRGMFRPVVSPGGAELHFDDASQLPCLVTDEAKVVQILRKFISNALKFTEHGEVRVHAESGPGDTIRISVRDTGVGIAPEDQPRVFEEFTQSDSPLQRKAKGTGLGLPFCRRLSELLGGRVELVSQKGNGSTFTLVLPRVYGADDAQARAQPAGRRPFTVLHVEDDEIDRCLVQQLLTTTGKMNLLHAEDGQSALEVAHREHPDLIILDIQLPRVNGLEVLESLQSAEDTREIPVAILSASIVEEDKRHLLDHTIAVLSKDDLGAASALVVQQGPPVSIGVRSGSQAGGV